MLTTTLIPDLSKLTHQQRSEWQKNGFFILRGFEAIAQCDRICEETIDAIRADPPEAHRGQSAYQMQNGLIVLAESPSPPAHLNAEDRVSKVFNGHLHGLAKNFAHNDRVVDLVSELLNDDVDVFQTQFILKNPGAWGQPWHQDSAYFAFERQPVVGAWLALTKATRENGCLSVVPGSHQEPLHEYVPDRRAGAPFGYHEIIDYDFSNEIPVLMEAGDLLIFHSFLMHRSYDNRAHYRRAAMVYHYCHAGAVALHLIDPKQAMVLKPVAARRALKT